MSESLAFHFPEIDGIVTPERAARIRELRVDQGHTWRSLASVCYDEFGGTWWPEWNQLAGVDLCRVAQAHFGEDWDTMPMPWETSAAVNLCPFCGEDATACACGKVKP